jgi:hypothetical protein
MLIGIIIMAQKPALWHLLKVVDLLTCKVNRIA